MNSSLRLQVTGERLRSLISLRLKDYDRAIERTQLAVTQLRAELAASDKEAQSNIDAIRSKLENASPVRGGNRYGNDPSETVGFSKMVTIREQIDKYGMTLESLQSYRAQTMWLHDAIAPDAKLEVSSDDLVVLGIGTGPLARSSVFDPLDM